MDSQIVVALVLAVLFFGAMGWLVVYSRLQDKKGNLQTPPKASDSETRNRAA